MRFHFLKIRFGDVKVHRSLNPRLTKKEKTLHQKPRTYVCFLKLCRTFSDIRQKITCRGKEPARGEGGAAAAARVGPRGRGELPAADYDSPRGERAAAQAAGGRAGTTLRTIPIKHHSASQIA